MSKPILEVPWLKEHMALYETDPVAAHDWDATPVGGTGLVPTLLLTTTGRRSGRARSIPLLYQPCAEGFLIVASRGGSREQPAWYLNLVANPRCAVRAGKRSCEATARTLSGAERERYWEWMTRFWPDYETYQVRTKRQIPVVILATDL